MNKGPSPLMILHVATLALFGVSAVLELVLGGVLVHRSVGLGLGFAAVAAVLLWGLGRSSRVAVGLASVGLVVGMVAAERLGAPVDPSSHLTTALGVGVLYALWYATRHHRPGAVRED